MIKRDVTYKELNKYCWTEDNRIQAMSDRRNGAWYNYDATGERNLKLTGQTMHVNQNGQDYYTPIFDQQTLYANPLITINDKGYTKHYFEEGKRICSKIGSGDLLDINNNIDGITNTAQDLRNIQTDGVHEGINICMGIYPELSNYDISQTVQEYEQQVTTVEPGYYYTSDHLGSSSYITDDNGDITQTLAYLPYGEDWVDLKHNNPQYQTPYKFNGKEKDEESGYHYYGARYYTSDHSIWLSVDPMSDKYPHLTSYNYCANNPVMLVDPDGRIIKSVFNRETNKLYIMDLDHYKKGLPIKHVSASDYQLGGIRDKNGNLTHNQVLVINNVFSGGQIENGKIVRVSGDRKQKAIPNATYDIVDNNADTRHKGWFRLDRQDNKRYNDKDEVTDRDGYRFHLGGLSWGCVTVDKTQDEAQVSWDVVTLILNSTSTTIVSEKRGRQWLNPFSKLIRYGTMEVKGADKIPYKTMEEE